MTCWPPKGDKHGFSCWGWASWVRKPGGPFFLRLCDLLRLVTRGPEVLLHPPLIIIVGLSSLLLLVGAGVARCPHKFATLPGVGSSWLH